MITREEREEYAGLLSYLQYTLHELPVGVLYDANGANDKKCARLMKHTYRLEALAVATGVDISEFLAVCRWHYERYPHYLGRHKHFGSYANYMEKHRAPALGMPQATHPANNLGQKSDRDQDTP